MSGEASLRRYGNGAVILRQGDRGDSMYMVLEGKVRIYRRTDENETTLGIVGPGEVFGEMALFDDEPRSASAAAVGSTEVRVIGRDEFGREECTPLARLVLKQMAQRLRAMNTAYEKSSIDEQHRREFMHQIPLNREWLV